MREIKFRGKRTDNGEWVEGFYFCMVHEDGRHVHHFIMPIGSDLNTGTPIEKIQVEVEPETVCQYTGLIDKNGKEIYEGDIFKCITGDDDEPVGKVQWHKSEFWVYWKDNWVLRRDLCFWTEAREIEVIGNIYENAELIDTVD